MQVLLRDGRVAFSYTDVFDTDFSEAYVVRVFSKFAHRMEFVKIMCALWAIFWAFLVAAFWNVSEGVDHFQTSFMASVDALMDAVYAISLLIQFNTTHLDTGLGVELCRRRAILRKTLNSLSFWCDVV